MAFIGWQIPWAGMTCWDPIQKPKQIRIEVPQTTHGLGGRRSLLTPASCLERHFGLFLVPRHDFQSCFQPQLSSQMSNIRSVPSLAALTFCNPMHVKQNLTFFYFIKWNAIAKGLVNKLNGRVLLTPSCFDKSLLCSMYMMFSSLEKGKLSAATDFQALFH